ncbi:AAA domain-containing protein, putative AbiEii toxin, Type IV TA system [Kosakonia oryzendophytica]|uniref:AAA domain-containing protein, putative AbiEii toxin, Type IV TA system n=1 Tax=Kosakonia oryzendophytica TaxID=1005665 RepID=A0A1C3ZES1_9ENTR|nr:AAA family ATPase [Kosakonia oryzendophytica]SCB80750.1 AAA domain-containing protein, putative AbiEii toxin, Type IV TA system [Kosakonia oryzendophytica]
MDLVKLKVSNIKNIKSADIELPMEGGVYSLVGGNGSGKSTLMLLLSVIVSSRRYSMLQLEDYDKTSEIEISMSIGGNVSNNKWKVSGANKFVVSGGVPIEFKGVYEGSLFYGSRFEDSRVVDNLIRSNSIKPEHIVDAFDYVKDNLSYILHGDMNHYRTLKKIKNKKISLQYQFSNVPYFTVSPTGALLSQYRMSSGECLLLSLLNYIYSTIVNSGATGVTSISPVFIDEIELALHPIAITRLVSYLNELVEQFPKVCVYLTSHSPEVIRSLKPENMFMINNSSGDISLINPCYPSYAIREVYRHDGFDYLVLVEDKLAEKIVDMSISDIGARESKLIHISPVGGWENVLSLHLNLLKNNVMGVNKKIISILDGDVKTDVSAKKEFTHLVKTFLPIPSIEKFIYSSIFEGKYPGFKKVLNDKYFPIKSIDELSLEHSRQFKGKVKNPDKKFYFRLKKDLESRNIDESYFISNLSEDIKREISFEAFNVALTGLLR